MIVYIFKLLLVNICFIAINLIYIKIELYIKIFVNNDEKILYYIYKKF